MREVLQQRGRAGAAAFRVVVCRAADPDSHAARAGGALIHEAKRLGRICIAGGTNAR